MNQSLIDKYFKDRCSPEELEEVLNWFKTDEGQCYLEKNIEEENSKSIDRSDKFLYPEIESERIYNRIQRSKNRSSSNKHRVYLRVASVLLIVGLVTSLLYWGGIIPKSGAVELDLITYIAQPGQHKIVYLSDGSVIRLNAGSKLIVFENFSGDKRKVKLTGEGYFEVAHNPSKPFIVNATGAVIRVLGTKFNVKTDTARNSVQVAVVNGKVSLQEKGVSEDFGAILTKNTFGMLHLFTHEIIIEKTPVSNYLSWMSDRLKFDGQSLREVSRQLERLYDKPIVFKSEQLKKLKLTANIERTDLHDTLNIIAETLGIAFKIRSGKIVWLNKL